jgi:hypothetical protein
MTCDKGISLTSYAYGICPQVLCVFSTERDLTHHPENDDGSNTLRIMFKQKIIPRVHQNMLGVEVDLDIISSQILLRFF